MDLSCDLEYFTRMGRLNGVVVAGDSKPLFKPGTLFNSKEKWWQGKGQRRTAHEGLDICFFQSDYGKLETIDSGWKVPVLWSGTVVRICDDFLGRTVIVSHGSPETQANELMSLYAHLQPETWLERGKHLDGDDVLGRIAAIDADKTSILPHLHISLLWNEFPFASAHLEWERLSQRQGVIFVDPLSYL